MNIDEFIERAQESARKHRYHADFFFHCMNCGQKFDWSDEE